ncbi:hypothetical protein [Acidiphilium sp.]|uniref:hypothetical protein n=1 Tax=Acidiphilium sp. TaxID=527 RepID=UPI003D0099F5
MDLAAAHAPPPLHDLLGASFVFNATITGLAWDGDAACFTLADGSVARLTAAWTGAPRLAPRPGGGVEIIAAAAPPPPPVIIAPPEGGTVSGGAEGCSPVLCRTNDGTVIAMVKPGGGVALRSPGSNSWTDLDVPVAASSMAITSADILVIGGAEGVYLWERATGLRHFAIAFGMRHAVAPVACHPRLGLIACADRTGAIVLGRPEVREVMLIRAAGSPPTMLEFAPTGEALAFATTDGEAGTMLLPDLLFRPITSGTDPEPERHDER